MLLKSRIYTDTSVIGGYFDEEFQDFSRKLFEEFITGKKILVLSDLTLKELEFAPTPVQEVIQLVPEVNREYLLFDDEAQFLAAKYLEEQVVTEKYLLDAQHIAIATVARVDVLVSWNFKHIVNLSRIRLYNSINIKYGYPIIEIRSPREVIDES